jgi:hypothetical protein
MRFTKLFFIIIAITLFIAGCNTTGTDDATYTEPYPNDVADSEIASGENTFWARENLDLQRIGNLLEQADDAEEFEYLLNSDEGINNLDLNGDGYVDYISVSEYEDGSDDQRGFTLFDRFGPNEIQEIARIIFDRNSYDDPGARILLVGNEQIYGDDYYYETNWLDRSLAIADFIFRDRNDHYESPYYYNNYPDYYEPYPVVETPVYRTRIEEYYPEPIFIRTERPTITNIKINSKYKNKSIDKIYAKLSKPTREQINFKRNNPNRPQFVEYKREKIKNVPPKFREVRERFRERNRNNSERRGKGDNKNFGKRDRAERQNVRPNNFERRSEKPNKVERQMQRSNKPNKADKPGRGNDKNRGGGNGKGRGKGKGKG